ncbi:hypothetical protein BRC89_07260 [Halobacteriales archaeon QS_4_70_19]|nr:MAG: hypothetical protein BRC89_07260 [Halobacteriales archaeon QS_4_70_19]
MTDAREVRALLDDRPDLEPALESLLETDAAHETWTFDRIGLDSGTFGELVSAGVVEKADGAYRLADPGAVERALSGTVAAESSAGPSLSAVDIDLDVDRRVAAALAGALVLVLCFRVFTFDTIFRDGQVVLSGNDPYFYLYWTEELSRQSGGVLGLSALTAGSFGLLKGEPLLVAVLWAATGLAGGVEQAPLVLAWYPVAAGVVTGAFTYLVATGLTDDERVGIAAVVMLAVMPALAFRSGLGYADHHAFDYLWLSLTAAGAVRLVRTPASRAAVTSPRTLAWAGVTGAAIAAQLLSWDAGPLLLFPLALFVPLSALVALDGDESPALTLAPLASGLAVAAVLAAIPHLTLGWQTPVVAFTPVLLLVGTGVVAVAGEAVDRAPSLPLSRLRAMAAIEVLGGLVALGVLTVGLPTYGDRLFERLGQVGTRGGIVEGNSLFAADTFGWLFLFGLLLFLGLPYMGWALLRATRGEDRHGWLLGGGYAWFFLGLAALQMRFAGEFSTFLAVFTGLGFVHIAERVDLARAPVPFRAATPARDDGEAQEPAFTRPSLRTAGSLLFLFLLLSGLSIAQAPVKARQVPIAEHKYETAVWVDGYAAEQGLEYPENYVFSQWGRNRMYNYVVSGQSRSYGFAQSNYGAFLKSTEPDVWYERLRGRVGFVVLNSAPSGNATLHARLTNGFGGRYAGYAGSGHYRAVRVTDRQQVHRVVPGGNLTGTVQNGTAAAGNATVRLHTEVTVSGRDDPVTYVRHALTDGDGDYHVRVAYPGEYELRHPDGTAATVTVPESAVVEGTAVDAGTLRGENATSAAQQRLRTVSAPRAAA